MRESGLFALTVLLVSTTLGFGGAIESQTVTVDCDAGDNLAKALAEADRGGPSSIRVLGTCRGNFRVESAGVELYGGVTDGSIIEGTESGPAIEIRSANRVGIRNLEIRGGTAGVRVLGPGSDVFVSSSRISAQFVDVWVSGASEAYLLEVDLFGSEIGMIVDDHSDGRLVDSVSRDHSIAGGTAHTHSNLFMTGSEITGNGEFGLSGQRVATIVINDSTLADNGEVHAFADDRSRLHLWGDCTVGGEDDPTEIALAIDDLSKLQTNGNVTVYGDLHGSRSSLVTVAISTIHGSVFLSDFANFVNYGSEIDGTVTCRTGADAVCPGGTVDTEGCPSAPPGCGTPTADTTEPTEGLSDLLLRRLDPNVPRNLRTTSAGSR